MPVVFFKFSYATVCILPVSRARHTDIDRDRPTNIFFFLEAFCKTLTLQKISRYIIIEMMHFFFKF